MSLPTVAIFSLGEMGAGIARLLTAHNYRVISNCTGRSAATIARANAAGVHLSPTDEDVLANASYILSIVPPGEALATAQRVVTALGTSPAAEESRELIYLDLNAISPSLAREINGILAKKPSIVHIDGGIIGGSPSSTDGVTWKKPSIIVSGPRDITNASSTSSTSSTEGQALAQVLNLRHIGPTIGPASGLKCCYASMTKGFTAIAIQSLTTAARMGVLGDLEQELNQGQHDRAFGGVSSMQSKAYRWVREMEEISKTFEEEGGFVQEKMFLGARDVYQFVAEDPVLGKNEGGNRAKSTDPKKTVQELAEASARRATRSKAGNTA